MKYSILLMILLGLCACTKSTVGLNLEVDEYIKLLRKNSFDQRLLPEFTQVDIPALLEYRLDRKEINVFPVNPISSFYAEKVRVGVYVLWTIESIRKVHNQSDELIMRFPSLNPIMRSTTESDLSERKIHLKAAEAYYDWWFDHKNQDFAEFSHIDPLENTSLMWQ